MSSHSIPGRVASASVPLRSRPRRLCRTPAWRRMVRETQLNIEELIYPLFVTEGEKQKVKIPSMPECFRFSLDLLLQEVKEVRELGIGAIALFPVIRKPGKTRLAAKATTQRD